MRRSEGKERMRDLLCANGVDRRRRTASLLSAVLTCLGCGASNRSAIVENQGQTEDGAILIAFDATRRGLVVVKQGESTYTCAEPPPDVAVSAVREFTGDFAAAVNVTGTGSGEARAEVARRLAESIQQISPTSEATTFLRSSLSQICWIAHNQALSAEQTQSLVDSVVSASRTLALRSVALDLVGQLESTNDPQARAEIARTIQILLVTSVSPTGVAEAFRAISVPAATQ